VDGLVCAAARAAAHAVRDWPGGLPDGSLVYRFGGWFEVGPASCPTARSRHFGGGFDSRWARRLTRRLARSAWADGSRRTRRLARRPARDASANGSTHARRRARRLAYIFLIGDGPGGLPYGSLVYRFGVMVGSSHASAYWSDRLTLRRMVGLSDASAHDSDRFGRGVLPNGSLDNCLTVIRISGSYAAATEFCFP